MGNLRTTSNRRGRDDGGAVLVEFALALPVLMMILVGIFSGGLVYNQKQQMTHATREGARYAASVPKAQSFALGTWASNVADLVVERSLGDLTSAQVCVALVQGNPGVVVGPGYSTSGAPCIADQPYPTTGSDNGLRVQVVASRPAKIDLAVLPSIDLTLSSSATAKSEDS